MKKSVEENKILNAFIIEIIILCVIIKKVNGEMKEKRRK